MGCVKTVHKLWMKLFAIGQSYGPGALCLTLVVLNVIIFNKQQTIDNTEIKLCLNEHINQKKENAPKFTVFAAGCGAAVDEKSSHAVALEGANV